MGKVRFGKTKLPEHLPDSHFCDVDDMLVAVIFEFYSSKMTGYHQAALFHIFATKFAQNAQARAGFPIIPLPFHQQAVGGTYPECIAVVIGAHERYGFLYEREEVPDFRLSGYLRAGETVPRTPVNPHVGTKNRLIVRDVFFKNIEGNLHVRNLIEQLGRSFCSTGFEEAKMPIFVPHLVIPGNFSGNGRMTSVLGIRWHDDILSRGDRRQGIQLFRLDFEAGMIEVPFQFPQYRDSGHDSGYGYFLMGRSERDDPVDS